MCYLHSYIKILTTIDHATLAFRLLFLKSYSHYMLFDLMTSAINQPNINDSFISLHKFFQDCCHYWRWLSCFVSPIYNVIYLLYIIMRQKHGSYKSALAAHD